MSLNPYPSIELRRYKVWKHVFDQRERWWEVYGSLRSWTESWNSLLAAGCDRSEQGGERAKVEPAAATLLAENHDAWFSEAVRAFAYAQTTNRVYPTRKASTLCYVGEAGVTVYAVTRVSALVTCYRPCVLGARISSEPTLALAYERERTRAQRAAVRRAERGASMGAEQ
ncbi:hypothetical protein LBMAG42_56440 [Deltaproteobacteria bacterium]|nr:hypothetical protein LBMAG42_56440 [Deltaproteobacteria bacterium]